MMAEFGFTELGLTRLEIVVAEGNHASRGLAEKLNATFEAIAQNRLILRGRPIAAAVYSLLPNQLCKPT